MHDVVVSKSAYFGVVCVHVSFLGKIGKVPVVPGGVNCAPSENRGRPRWNFGSFVSG
jgi:hypothetical protein